MWTLFTTSSVVHQYSTFKVLQHVGVGATGSNGAAAGTRWCLDFGSSASADGGAGRQTQAPVTSALHKSFSVLSYVCPQITCTGHIRVEGIRADDGGEGGGRGGEGGADGRGGGGGSKPRLCPPVRVTCTLRYLAPLCLFWCPHEANPPVLISVKVLPFALQGSAHYIESPQITFLWLHMKSHCHLLFKAVTIP